VPKLTAGGYKVRVVIGLGRGIAVQVASRRALLAAPDDATNALDYYSTAALVNSAGTNDAILKGRH
jgi:hypothetical protein